MSVVLSSSSCAKTCISLPPLARMTAAATPEATAAALPNSECTQAGLPGGFDIGRGDSSRPPVALDQYEIAVRGPHRRADDVAGRERSPQPRGPRGPAIASYDRRGLRRAIRFAIKPIAGRESCPSGRTSAFAPVPFFCGIGHVEASYSAAAL